MVNQPSLEVIAPTIEEALSRGLEQLGVSADAVTIEVLDPGSRGFLGFGARQVRLRLTLKPPEETVMGQIQRKMQPEEKKQPAPPPPPQSAAPPPPPAAAAPQAKAPAAAEPPAEESAAAEKDTVAQVQDVVENLLQRMGIPYQEVRVRQDERDADLVYVDINGRDLGMLIGRKKAEVLNAFQYIVSLIIGKRLEHWVQVVVDVQGYRKRRERALQIMAQRLADQAVKTGRRQMLEPMPANERRIVHLALRDRDDVETLSVGEEPNRKVTIAPRQ